MGMRKLTHRRDNEISRELFDESKKRWYIYLHLQYGGKLYDREIQINGGEAILTHGFKNAAV